MDGVNRQRRLPSTHAVARDALAHGLRALFVPSPRQEGEQIMIILPAPLPMSLTSGAS